MRKVLVILQNQTKFESLLKIDKFVWIKKNKYEKD
jgi:hypothetical protein